jgi:hypothetical protein
MHTDLTDRRPLVTFFFQPYPSHAPAPDQDEELGSYSDEQHLNVSLDGTPLHLARSKSPYTSAYTPGHTIPGGYTPSGKYKSPKVVPGKMDKRAGK